jgi:hypothetical protein
LLPWRNQGRNVPYTLSEHNNADMNRLENIGIDSALVLPYLVLVLFRVHSDVDLDKQPINVVVERINQLSFHTYYSTINTNFAVLESHNPNKHKPVVQLSSSFIPIVILDLVN